MSRYLILLNIFIPILGKLLVPDGRHGWIPVIAIDGIIVPIILLVINAFVYLKKSESSLFRNFLLMFFGLILGDCIGYSIWGFSSGLFFHPDGNTVYLFTSLLIYHMFLTLLSFFLVRIGLVILKKNI